MCVRPFLAAVALRTRHAFGGPVNLKLGNRITIWCERLPTMVSRHRANHFDLVLLLTVNQ